MFASIHLVDMSYDWTPVKMVEERWMENGSNSSISFPLLPSTFYSLYQAVLSDLIGPNVWGQICPELKLTRVRGNYLTNILKLIDMDIYTSTDQTWLNSPKH